MNAEDSPQAIRSKIFVEFWFDDRNSNNCWVFPSFDEVKVIPDTNKSCFFSSSPRPFCCIVSSLLNVINVIFLTTQQMIIFYKPDTEKHMKPSSKKAEKSALHESCCFCSMLWYYYISFIMVYQQAMDDEHEQYLWLVTAVRYRGRVNMLIWISQ